MIVPDPKIGDIVLYYAERNGEQIRLPYRAEVTAVYPKTNVTFARSPAMQYGPAVDLRVFNGITSFFLEERVPYAEDTVEDVYWAWP